MILLKSIVLFLVLMCLGTFLTLKLFNFDLKKFRKSELSNKILSWIPIFIVFIFIVFSSDFFKYISLSTLLFIVVYEYLRVVSKVLRNRLILTFYIILLLIAFSHLAVFGLVKQNVINLLLALGFGCALSDVMGFFFGSYFGFHKLPNNINNLKSWEGILGQIIGALISTTLIKIFVLYEINILLFIPIGVGSTLGDILNSFVKRKVSISKWSNFVPGHGGFIDRFSSFAFSILFTFYFLLLFRIRQ